MYYQMLRATGITYTNSCPGISEFKNEQDDEVVILRQMADRFVPS
jgi:hypothetical protein